MIDINPETLEMAKKWVAYKNDIVLFTEECIMLPLPGGDTLCKLYEPQKKVLRSFLEDHFLCLLKSRQTGFSTLSQIIAVYISTFHENSIMGVLSRDSAESSDFCRKTEDLIDKLPVWLRPEYKSKSVQSYILSNGCALFSSAISPANPSAVFRGKSIVVLFCDESSHCLHLDKAWVAIAPALSKAQKVAKDRGIPFGTVVLSTPNRTQGVGKFFYQMWSQAQNEDNIFKPWRIHWTEIPDFVEDPNWYKQQCDLLGNDERKIAQELELKFVGSENTLFPEKTQLKLSEANNSNILQHIPVGNRHQLRLYKMLNKETFYIIGVDTASEAGGHDYSAIEVFEYVTMEQVLEFKGKLAVKRFAEIVKLVAKLCTHNILVVENNSYGNQVIEELVYDNEYKFNLFGEVRGKNNPTFIPGLATTMKTRPLIVDALYHYVTENPEMVKSERLALELLGLTDKVKRVEADIGSNDDLALALGFICYARHYATDLIGSTETADDGATAMMDESLSLISSFNMPDHPLLNDYKTQDFHIFKKSMDRYLKANLGCSLSGPINTMKLFMKNKDIFNIL